MKGTIKNNKGSYYVRWWAKKDYKIYYYKGIRIGSNLELAEKLLQDMRSDFEDKTFYIEKYIKKDFSDVITFIDSWLENAEDLAPATYKGYKSYVNNHIKPFFQRHNRITLPDIQLDVLENLRKSLKKKGLSPKYQINIMYCMHLILDEAKRSRRIQSIPSFPKKKKYQQIKKPIEWLPEDRQLNVIEQIPKQHQPIFYFLKYHLRRIAEACVIHKSDFDGDVFTIHRSVSARQETAKTKTGEIHTIPCHPDFEPYLEIEREKQKKLGVFSPYLFVNPMARKKGKRYTNESLNIIWKKACKKAGEDIWLYGGVKHSSCSQYINEKGLSESELQIITDHARIESVRNYAKTEVKRKRELMVKNIFKLDRKKRSK